jgi:hypothetical protein
MATAFAAQQILPRGADPVLDLNYSLGYSVYIDLNGRTILGQMVVMVGKAPQLVWDHSQFKLKTGAGKGSGI